ncbi:uncharacterized protein LOC132201507 isoform X2 [Neocloeon triangulifer]|uniref:uncharacterized protein LOC132201507 isoform X2 n=1 Tax=Neocloeon triangulifer TaxID=2078957 RepID=UPI00286F8BAC|nr:uncharacterized protein LOC132201507 isoform X2 [Neocloeon triangulifer]
MQRALLASMLLLAAASWDAQAASIPSEDGTDSLRGALEALDRRQRALQQRPQYSQHQHANRYPLEKKDNQVDEDSVELIADDGQPEDIGYGYQRERHEGKLSPEQLKQAMLAVLSEQDDNSDDEGEDYSEETEEKRGAPASMFRERNQQGRQHHKRSSPAADDERKYRRLLAALWDKYQTEEQQEQKRQDGYGGYGGYDGYDFYNSPMGWGQGHFDGVKRNYDGYGYDLYNSPMAWGDGHFEGYRKRSAEDDSYYPAYQLPSKRITLRKRSSGAPLHEKTDDKTKAELAEIFDKKASATDSSHKAVATTAKPAASTTGSAGSTAKPQQKVIKKKSVDWSQYFGIDKRGKNLDEMDDEERKMMERYYRTFALATTLKKKRSTPMVLHSGEPKSLENMDQKLKAMEDLIVDEAVKFTGAHQGTADPAQIRKIKEQVLERLAAAYSLEKMRQALVEFRSSLKGHSLEKRSVQ